MSIEILEENDTGCFKSIEEFYEWHEKFTEYLIEHIGDVATVIADAVVGEMATEDFELVLEELEDETIYEGTCITGEIKNNTPLAEYKLPKELKEIFNGKEQIKAQSKN